MRRLQIGVIGSNSDLKYGKELESIAENIGKIIAEKNCILLFGAEKTDSLSTVACKGAKKKDGIVVAVSPNKDKEIFQKDVDVIISTGSNIGGGREFVFILSCDAIIVIGGGSGTLGEIAIAYQANIPIIVLENSGGWAGKLANSFLDERKRELIHSAKTPEMAVELAINLAKERIKN